MDYFFGYENKLNNEIDWMFNSNHLFLIIFVALIIISFLFLFNAKSSKGIKVTKFFIASLLLVLEVGRIVYKYKMHIYYGGNSSNFNWWWNISFQMCAIMTWTTIFTLIFSVFANKNNYFLQFMYNILFGCAMIGGILTFCYPDCIHEDYPFFHFINIQTILVHALLIFVPLYLIKIKDFKAEIKNIWKVSVGYLYIGSIAMTTSIISGNNFAFTLKLDLVELGVSFPWHLPILLLVMLALASLFYAIFEIVSLIKRKHLKDNSIGIKETNVLPFGKAIYIVSNICAILFGTLMMLIIAGFIGSPNETGNKTILGLLCLIGLVYMILILIFTYKNRQYVYKNITDNRTKHIIFIVLTLIFELPVGIMYLIRYLKENKGERNNVIS